jgi:hypothetical protein
MSATLISDPSGGADTGRLGGGPALPPTTTAYDGRPDARTDSLAQSEGPGPRMA